jgi:cell division protein FtsQ
VSGLVRAESLFRARRRERRRRTARPVLLAAIATTVVGAALWVGYSSPVLRLTSITVKGTSRLATAQVLAAARVPTGGSLLSVPVAAVRRRVLALAPVAGVRISRSWPHGLVIDVTERRPVAVVLTGGRGDAGAVLLDAHGVAFATDATAPPGLLDLRVEPGPLGAASAPAVAALQVWSQLPGAVRREVRWMSAGSTDDVTFALTRGSTVVWGSPAAGTDKLTVLAALLRHRAQVYDVSTPGVAVTR